MKTAKQVIMKLQRMLMQFATIETDKEALSYEGELAPGTAVYIATSDADPVPAPDGDYKADGKTIAVAGGKIVSITEDAPDPPADPEPDNAQMMTQFAAVLEKINEKIDAKFSAIDGNLKTMREIMADVEGRVAKFAAQPAGNPIIPDKSKGEPKEPEVKITGRGSLIDVLNAKL